MMGLKISILSVLCELYGITWGSSFDPTLTVRSCTLGKLVVHVTNTSDSGIIYIQGQGDQCKFPTSPNITDYEFDFDLCNVQWQMILRVIIQQKSGYQTGNDKRIPVLCVADTADLIATNLLEAQKDDNAGQNMTTRPEVTMKFFKVLTDEEVIGREIKLSDRLIMSMQLESQYTDDFDIKAKHCVASGLTLIQNFCATDEELFPNFWKPSQGHLFSEFGAFRPTTFEGGAVLINFTCIVQLCKGYCTPSMCGDVYNGFGRRKRSMVKLGQSILTGKDATREYIKPRANHYWKESRDPSKFQAMQDRKESRDHSKFQAMQDWKESRDHSKFQAMRDWKESRGSTKRQDHLNLHELHDRSKRHGWKVSLDRTMRHAKGNWKVARDRTKRQTNRDDFFDVGRTIKVVEEYSEIRVVTETEVCWDKYFLMMIIILLSGGFLAAVVCSVYLFFKLKHSRKELRVEKRLHDEDKDGDHKVTGLDSVHLNPGNTEKSKSC